MVMKGNETRYLLRALRRHLARWGEYDPYREILVMTLKELDQFIADEPIRWEWIMDNAVVLYGMYPSDFDEMGT